MTMPYAPAWGLKLVRRVRRLSRGGLAAATRVPVELIADYEEERQPLPGETLLAVIEALGFTAKEREALSRAMPHLEPRGWQAPFPGDPSPELRRLIEEASWEVGERLRRFAIWRMLKGGDPWQIEGDIEREQGRTVDFGYDLFLVQQMTFQDELRKRSRQPSPEDRKEAAEQWGRMKRLDASLRRAIVEVSPEFRHWALCERLGLESLKLARRTPDEAMELAELALDLARRIQSDPAWRRRLRGFALACLGNARLAQGDRARAEEELAQARRLWEAGTASGTEVLDETPLRRLAASLQ